jgi:hypothetical protein
MIWEDLLTKDELPSARLRAAFAAVLCVASAEIAVIAHITKPRTGLQSDHGATRSCVMLCEPCGDLGLILHAQIARMPSLRRRLDRAAYPRTLHGETLVPDVEAQGP